MTKVLFLLLSFSYCVFVSAQQNSQQKAVIDKTVKAIDAGNWTSAKFIVRNKENKWQYTTHASGKQSKDYIKIERRTRIGEDSIIQQFYIRNKQLIQSSESIVSYNNPNDKADYIAWGGTYYFDKGELIDMVTLGHGKSEDPDWDPTKEVLANYKEALQHANSHKQ